MLNIWASVTQAEALELLEDVVVAGAIVYIGADDKGRASSTFFSGSEYAVRIANRNPELAQHHLHNFAMAVGYVVYVKGHRVMTLTMIVGRRSWRQSKGLRSVNRAMRPLMVRARLSRRTSKRSPVKNLRKGRNRRREDRVRR